MVREDWVVGGDRRSAAAERIYSAATELVLAHGVDAFDIDKLAQRLHCSRATVYRHAGGKAHIRDVVLLRLASQVIDSVRAAVAPLDGTTRVTEAISVALREIRSHPLHGLMLNAGIPERMGELHSSPMLSRLAAQLCGITDDDQEAALWIVRIVMSMALWPVQDPRTERQFLRRFVAPAFPGVKCS